MVRNWKRCAARLSGHKKRNTELTHCINRCFRCGKGTVFWYNAPLLMGGAFSCLFKKTVIVGQTGEKQRKKGSALLALREKPVADCLQLIGVVEGGHMLTGTASGWLICVWSSLITKPGTNLAGKIQKAVRRFFVARKCGWSPRKTGKNGCDILETLFFLNGLTLANHHEIMYTKWV